jgi:fermentation-respiration switch protein FrsA (DUF1100 family)
MQPVVTVLAVTALTAVCALIIFLGMLWQYQERLVFQPPAPPYPDGGSTRRIGFRAPDGQLLFAYLVNHPSQRGVVIAFHGNADLAAWQIPWATELGRRSGYAVLLPEYRGYAGLSGSPAYSTARSDAHAAYGLARDSLEYPPDRIVLFGHSLGSAIAAELASGVRPATLVLQSPLASAREMARQIATPAVVLFWTGLARVHYDTEKLVRTLDVPVWVVHGTHDAVIPVRMGERVFTAAARKGELLLVDDAGHNDLESRGGEQYWSWLLSALTSRQQGTVSGRE